MSAFQVSNPTIDKSLSVAYSLGNQKIGRRSRWDEVWY